jgi:glycosyltransferase involved in cell wall biosynthesis
VSRFLGSGIERMTGKKYNTIIPNVVDTTLFHSQEEKYSRFSFVHVSNMVQLKNVDLILKAFNRLLSSVQEEPQLILVGNRNDDHVKMANEMGLLNRSVFFRGEVSYSEVAEEVRRSHCFVLFSDSETFSCVTAEALCCGLPVIASKVGALPELIDQGNGILVETGNVDALEGAMKNMMDRYAGFDARSISKKATEQYGYPAVAERFKALYEG